MDLPMWEITEEERTRNEALFYSQKPQNGFLSGEQARALFIRSKLPLPELSKIWKLTDVTRDNMLDISEFLVAMHLIQCRLRGIDIPVNCPQNLMPIHISQLEVPVMTQDEKDAYEKTFAWKDKDKSGFLGAELASSILLASGLSSDILAKIWNLSDVDRDGKLSSDEFAIALHLVRFCRKGNSLDGSIDVMAVLPHKNSEDDLDNKKQRLTEVQTQKRRFLSLKEKLCHEIAGGLTEDVIAHNIRPELNRVEGQLHFLEKEENELRRALQHMKDKSKKESFKPFDRSFLLKRRPCGQDIFRDAEKNLRGVGNNFEQEIENQLIVGNGPVFAVDSVTSESSPCSPDVVTDHVIRREETASQDASVSEQSVERPSGETAPLANGVEGNASGGENNGVAPVKQGDIKTDLEDRRNNAESLNESSVESLNESSVESLNEGSVESLNEGSVESLNEGSDMQAVELEGSTQPDEQVDQVFNCSENSNGLVDANCNSVKEQVAGELSNGHESTFASSTKISENEDIIQKTLSSPPVVCVSLHKLDEIFQHLDEEFSVSDNLHQAGSPVEDGVVAMDVASTSESAVEGNMNTAFEEQESGKKNGVAVQNNAVVDRMRRQPTQEELIPIFLEERRTKEEERKKKREIEEEELKSAREERDRLEQERIRESKLSKASFKEEREKLEKQVSSAAAAEKEQRTKMCLTRTEATKMVEKELEEQRIREVQTQMELERIKEREKREMGKKKTPAKNEEHPVAYKKRASIIEKPIFHDDPGEEQGGSVELDNEARRLAETKTREIECAEESQVVRRRPKVRSGNEEEKTSNRKSIVELDIERQRAREEDMKSENDKRQQEAQRFKEGVQQGKAATRRMSTDSEYSAGRRNEEYEITQKERERQEAELRELEARRIQELVRKQSQVAEMVEPSTLVEIVNAPPDFRDEIDATVREDEARRLEERETRLEEKRLEEKRLEEKRLEEKRLEEKRLVEKRLEEKRLEEKRLEEKRLEEKRLEEKRLEEKRLEEKRLEEEHLEEKRLEEERLEEERLEEKRLEEERERKRKEVLEKVRKEALKREADQLLREKRLREEEQRRKREAQLLEAEKRERERKEAKEHLNKEAQTTRASFYAHKVMLEQRVLKALQESSDQTDTVKRRTPDDQSGKDKRKGKRFSLNLDDVPNHSGTQSEVVLRNKPEKKSGMRDRSTFYADEVVSREIQVTIETGEGRLEEAQGTMPRLSERRKQFEKGTTPASPSALDTRQAVDRLSPREHRNETLQRQPRKVSSGDVVDAGGNVPYLAEKKIRHELEEQRRREDMLRKETEKREQEKMKEIEMERRKMTSPVPPGQVVACVDEVKKAPPANKLQVRKPSVNRSRDSLTQTMAAQWESFISTKESGIPQVHPPSNTERKFQERAKSFIELEREKERERELEVQREHELLQRERQRKIDEKESEKRRKEDEELQKKRKIQEEKDKRQQRTSAMKSMWERMGSKN